MMNLPPQPGPHELAGVPVISETNVIFEGSESLEVMSKIWYFRSMPVSPLRQRFRVANQVVAP